jgi:hypothetical protein
MSIAWWHRFPAPTGVGEGPGEPADDRLAGDGPVFVVIAQVGVEVAGEPVPGVVCEEAQHHLQARRQVRSSATLAPGSMTLAGSLAGILSRAASVTASAVCPGYFLLRGGDQPGVSGGGRDGRVARMPARSSRAAVSTLSAFRTARRVEAQVKTGGPGTPQALSVEACRPVSRDLHRVVPSRLESFGKQR